jgi:ATP-binding cassette subfamily B protein
VNRALRVAGATGPHLLVGGVVLALAGSVAPAASASLFRTLIDSIQQSGSLGAVLPAAVVVSLAGALAVLLPAASDLLARRLTGFMKVREHDELFRSINRHDDMAVFDDPEFHSQLTLARERGIDASGEVIAGGLLFAQSAVLGLGFFGVLLSTYPPLAACAAVVAVPVVMIELSLGKVRLASAKELNSYSRERFLYSQAMAGHREAKEVRLLGIGDLLRGRARTQFEKAIDAEHRLARREFSMHLAATSLGLGLSLGMLVWAIVRYRAGSLSLGDLTVVASAGAGIIQGLSGSVAHLGRVHHALDVQGVLKDLLAIDGPAGGNGLAGPSTRVPAGEAPPLADGVEFVGVSFRYPGQPSWAVDGVDLRIGADQMVAMVGANGSGKTTLAKLACRLYEPARGVVMWNGVDVRAFTHESLRRRVGVLFQDFVIYEFSVSDNIGIGDVAQIGCLRAVQSSAVASGADAVIDALPRGYGTRLTRMFPDPEDEEASGVVLSGGQAQRVSIARLLMRSDADLLILDEPTSGLDPAAEAELLETLRRSRAGKATVFITHRLGAARNADLILVVAGGTVVEQGSHDDLVARDGEYARLYQLQAAGYEDVPG